MCNLILDHVGLMSLLGWELEYPIPWEETCHLGEAILGELQEHKFKSKGRNARKLQEDVNGT